MQESIKLSIIMPIYNGEKYIENLCSNLLKHSHFPFEIVIVDDKSTDNTTTKIETIIRKNDLKILLIKNEENIGPGESRNKGVQAASGEYITFLDSDDSFSDSFFDEVFSIMSKSYDVITFDAQLTFDDKPTKYYSMFISTLNEGIIDRNTALVYINGCTWGKIYKKSVIINNHIKFLNLKRNEDTPFTKVAIANSKQIWYIKKPLYNYYQNQASLMHDLSLLSAKNAQDSFLYINKKLSNKYPEETEAIFLIEYLYSTVLTNSITLKRRELIDYIVQCERMYPNCYNNRYLKKFPKKNILVLELIRKRKVGLLSLIAKLRIRAYK